MPASPRCSRPFQPIGRAAAHGGREPADPRRPCFRSANVRRLAALPPGLVAADIDLGPYIVALSPHRVVAAPYHRLEQGHPRQPRHHARHAGAGAAHARGAGRRTTWRCARTGQSDKGPTRERDDIAARAAARWRPLRLPARAGSAGRRRHQGLEGRAGALSRLRADQLRGAPVRCWRGRRLAGAAGGSGAISGSALGQAKSSARPGLVARRSPLIST